MASAYDDPNSLVHIPLHVSRLDISTERIMNIRNVLAATFVVTLLVACADDQVTEAPAPAEPTQNSTGHYCNMTVVEHSGPKGHIFLNGQENPIWFTSVRDAIAFTMLPEESKDIAAVYVNDMARATNWDHPEADTWVEARQAIFVIGSSRVGGMGAPEAVPFSDHMMAASFASKYGGHAVAFVDIPHQFILSDPNDDDTQMMNQDHAMHGNPNEGHDHSGGSAQ